MRRLVILVLVLLMVVPSAFATRKREMAGTVKDNVYQDAQYGFQLTVDPNWKSSVGKSDDNARIVMLQKKYAVPPQYQNAQDYAQIPRLAVFADTTSMSAAAFVDSILSPSYKSRAKKALSADFEFLGFANIVVKSRRVMELAKQSAVVWNAENKYVKDVASASSANMGTQVSGSYSGMMVAVKSGSTILVFYLVCETDFFGAVSAESDRIIKSLTWMK